MQRFLNQPHRLALNGAPYSPSRKHTWTNFQTWRLNFISQLKSLSRGDRIVVREATNLIRFWSQQWLRSWLGIWSLLVTLLPLFSCHHQLIFRSYYLVCSSHLCPFFFLLDVFWQEVISCRKTHGVKLNLTSFARVAERWNWTLLC